MSTDPVDQIVASMQQKLEEILQSAVALKQTINQVLQVHGRQPLYADAELQASSGPSLSISPDEFFSKPLASCVRHVLELRRASKQGPATITEIYAALLAGGFDFERKSEANAKRSLAISLGKNLIFQRLPNDRWGMRDWYGQGPKGTKRERGQPENDSLRDGSENQADEQEGEL